MSIWEEVQTKEISKPESRYLGNEKLLHIEFVSARILMFLLLILLLSSDYFLFPFICSIVLVLIGPGLIWLILQ